MCNSLLSSACHRSLQLLGLSALGFSTGFEQLHYMFEGAFDGDDLSLKFLKVLIEWRGVCLILTICCLAHTRPQALLTSLPHLFNTTP